MPIFAENLVDMDRKTLTDALCEMGHDDAILFDNPSFDDAIIGVSDNGQICYQYEKMVECLSKEDGMDEESAAEFIDYNTIRALPYVKPQDKRPVIIYAIWD